MAVAAHLLLRDQRGQVLFQRRAGTGYADGCWALPAGHVEVDEAITATCVREAREEIGVQLSAEDLRFVLVQHKLDVDGDQRIDVFFEATLPTGATPSIEEPHKCDALDWSPLVAPPCPVPDFLRAALDELAGSQGSTLACFGFTASA
jgi:8-oxo-dGTP pyrophosphatase MutT (NUDIX family)